MGRKPRPKPRRTGKKLRQIRATLGLSQNEILKRMGLEKECGRNNLSNYELDKREPPASVVLGYAQLAGINVKFIIDDKLELPDRFNNSTLKKRPKSQASISRK
jgi:transcriptional regulator with XRE-family HTH domain